MEYPSIMGMKGINWSLFLNKGRQQFVLNMKGPAITRAIGIGGKVICYKYTPQGQLQEVQDREGVLKSYDYDKDLHLVAIIDAKGNKVFEAYYDSYNRAEEKVINGRWF
jgi:YD repeat-containing protein